MERNKKFSNAVCHTKCRWGLAGDKPWDSDVPSHTETNSILGCITSNARRLREAIFPFYSTLMMPHLEPCVYFQASHRKSHGQTADIFLESKGWYWDCLGQRKEDLGGSFHVHKNLRGGWKEDRAWYSQSCPVGGLEEMGTSWVRGYSLWISGSISSLLGCLNHSEVVQEKLWSHLEVVLDS